MYVQPYLRTQAELLADIQADGYTTALGWSTAEVYRALNRALSTWQTRVRVARLYTLPDGWVSGTFDYTLPSYVRRPYIPEFLRSRPYDDSIDLSLTSDQSWQTINGWVENPDSTGGLTLRVTMRPYTVDGRVVWYAPNSRVPTGTAPTTNAEITATATSVTMGSAVDVDDSGWVKIGAEWIMYSGITRAAATTTLTNLVRAQYGTTAATQASSSSVVWGVAVDNLGLYEQLANQTKVFLHQQMLVNTSVHETGRHERLMQFYQTMADAFWKNYSNQLPAPQMVLDRRYLLR